jgi:flagellar FliL protein
MKKSLITLITLVLVLVNTVLTALLVFTILPETKKANQLITKVASAIDLDMSAGQSTGSTDTSLETTEAYTMADTITCNLKKDTDGTEHYAVLGVVLNINKNSDGYKKGTYTKDKMNTYDGVIKSAVTAVVPKYTLDQIQSNTEQVQDEIKDELANAFGGDVITSVRFSTATYQ